MGRGHAGRGSLRRPAPREATQALMMPGVEGMAPEVRHEGAGPVGCAHRVGQGMDSLGETKAPPPGRRAKRWSRRSRILASRVRVAGRVPDQSLPRLAGERWTHGHDHGAGGIDHMGRRTARVGVRRPAATPLVAAPGAFQATEPLPPGIVPHPHAVGGHHGKTKGLCGVSLARAGLL